MTGIGLLQLLRSWGKQEATSARKRTSTALHALASETPTAKSKAHSHTEFGEAGP